MYSKCFTHKIITLYIYIYIYLTQIGRNITLDPFIFRLYFVVIGDYMYDKTSWNLSWKIKMVIMKKENSATKLQKMTRA